VCVPNLSLLRPAPPRRTGRARSGLDLDVCPRSTFYTLLNLLGMLTETSLNHMHAATATAIHHTATVSLEAKRLHLSLRRIRARFHIGSDPIALSETPLSTPSPVPLQGKAGA
jgi:hypothetical protein